MTRSCAGRLLIRRGIIVLVRAKTANVGRRVVTVLYEGAALFEFAIASEIFGDYEAADLGVDWYQHVVCAPTRTVRLDTGLTVQVPRGLAALRYVDTVVLPPCRFPERIPEATLAAVRRAHERGARVVSLCTGAFVLAATGLLDGRRATTHWAECAEFRRQFPEVDVDPGVLYVDDGDILTSAGSAAAVDLCLHIVRSDYGADVAARLARQLVVPPHRDGGQAQYIDHPIPEPSEYDLFADALAWAQQHLNEQISINDLATRSAMSPRTFARHFAAHVGTTPYQWLLRQRIDLARRLLETTELPVDDVAARTGFGDPGNLRRHFHQHVRTTPQAYRRTFANVS
jgi:transcriptional regulator GlxA family with amidase domain